MKESDCVFGIFLSLFIACVLSLVICVTYTYHTRRLMTENGYIQKLEEVRGHNVIIWVKGEPCHSN